MNTLKDLRNQQYDYHKKQFPYLFDYIKNPYSFLKAKFYMESSAVLVYLLLRTNIKPNTVTIIYGLLGIVTGILLSIPNNYTIFIALIIAFTKGTLDWSDGHFARITGQTSLTGHILDIYGAHLNSLGLQIGLGLYIANNSDTLVYYYLVPLLLFFRIANLYIFSKTIMFDEIPYLYDPSSLSNIIESNKKLLDDMPNSRSNIYVKIKKYFLGFLDDRARSVDFICLIILLELLYSFNIVWVIFLLILIKYFIIFIISLYNVSKGGWVENSLNKKLVELHTLFQNTKS